MSRNYIFCNNCGESGHAFHQCKKPITSMGTIVYRYDKGINQYKYLLICRKDTLGFVDFMRGKYPINDKNYIKNILEEMTIEERKRLVTQNFDTLWKNLWGDHIGIQYRGEEKTSRDKMQQLKNLQFVVNCSVKGRPKLQETGSCKRKTKNNGNFPKQFCFISF